MLISFCGGRLFGEVYGSGNTRAVALPGWRRSHGDYEKVGNGLPFAMAALDPPGFGATPPPDEPWGSVRYGELIASAISEIGAPVVLVGHSFGGRVAVQVAAGYPELVSALVLTGVPLLPSNLSGGRKRPPARFRVVRQLHKRGLISEKTMENARQKYGSVDYRQASGVMRSVLVASVNESYEEVLSRITCPVELVWADDDAEVPIRVAEGLAAAITGSKLTICPGAGHILPLTAPEALRQAIQRAAA
ncbi:MAG TPA: alpha/beta hydrolase [Acidimicrobiales bacterium]|nr:alpha/beta hydrolase [Acidimicrobiales bacterium]